MSSPLPVPVADTPQQRIRALRRLEQQIAELILAAHGRIWPNDVPGQYTVVHRVGKNGRGRAKVTFGPPPVKEPGFEE